jgi:DNA repair protein SbcC/Rad50
MQTQFILKNLKISYFKGIKSLNKSFGPTENFVFGKNEAGKTTLFDSVWFLLFGKDSTGRAKFSIKTYDSNNNIIEKVNTEVEATFDINGNTKTFKRIFKELWDKSTNTLTGNTTNYEVDGFPVRTEKEYKAIIDSYFKEDTFKILTNPLFFNSLDTLERRNTLISLVPEMTDEEVFKSLRPSARKSVYVQQLELLLADGKQIEAIKLKASRDKKLYRDEKDAIPDRIDEARRNMPEVYDFNELQEIISEKKGELAAIDQQIIDANNTAAAKNKAIQEIQNQIWELKTKLQKLEFMADSDLRKHQNDANSHPQQLQDKIKSLSNEAKGKQTLIEQKNQLIDRIKKQIETLEENLARYNRDRELLLAKFNEINEQEFTWNGSSCTACQRPFEGAQALDAEETARANFNNDKAKKIADIQATGKSVRTRIDNTTQEIETEKQRIRDIQSDITALTEQMEETKDGLITIESSLNEWYSQKQEVKTAADFLSPEHAEIKAKIEELENKKPEETKADNSELIQQKQVIQTALEGLQKALGNKETIEKTNQRIQELKEQESELANKISEAEGMEQACFTFSKARMDQIESAINSKFELVNFKMFHMPINGEEKEICDTIYKGVPFQDLNTAGKIQAGLDIINALSRHHQLYLPIFIDNRESTTWIPEVQSQVINLVVDPESTELRVVGAQEELATV